MRISLLVLASLAAPALADEAVPPEGTIVVTATRRAQPLVEVPAAVSVVTGDRLLLAGARDLKQAQQLVPSLYLASGISESGATVARIRGLGTAGGNAGLDTAVGLWIDNVYRPRAGVALTELGGIERVDVLRGPQGTLYGRNATVGVIAVTTRGPLFEDTGEFEAEAGNYGHFRVGGGVTQGVVPDRFAIRIDGVWTARDGFVEDVISGDTIGNRGRYMVRLQGLWTPRENVSVRIIADHTKRDENCCAAVYLPFRTTRAAPGGGIEVVPQNDVVDLIRRLGGVISDDPFARETSVTPGRRFRSDVREWGLSAEVEWRLPWATLTSVSAFRDWRTDLSQDLDFNNLDLVAREAQSRRFRTVSQDLRLQGTRGRLDWLVGAYVLSENLAYADSMTFGEDYVAYADALVRSAAPGFPGYDAVAGALGVPGLTGARFDDRFDQRLSNFALYTHDRFELTERWSLTAGLRFTRETKRLEAVLDGDNPLCEAIRTSAFQAATGLACFVPGFDVDDEARRTDNEWTGMAQLAFAPRPGLLFYGGWSRGTKAGGFNLDRVGLVPAAPDLDDLAFDEEVADSVELGVKWARPGVAVNLAGFRTVVDGFQTNVFDGQRSIVSNVVGCRDDLLGGDRDFAGLPVNGVPLTEAEAAATGACDPDRTEGGVVSSGFEAEAALRPLPDLAVALGLTWADVRYRDQLAGTDGAPLATALFNTPGGRLVNAPEWVQTGAVTWTPGVGGQDFRALVHVDWRYQSASNPAADLFPEHAQGAFTVVGARAGFLGPDDRWTVEFWVRNLLDAEYAEVGVNMTLQGTGTAAQTVRGGPAATTLFGVFPGEPRTYGVTLRSRF